MLGSTEGSPGHSLSCPAQPPATLRSSLPAPGQEGSGDLQTSVLMTVREQQGFEVPALRRRINQCYSLITRLAGEKAVGTAGRDTNLDQDKSLLPQRQGNASRRRRKTRPHSETDSAQAAPSQRGRGDREETAAAPWVVPRRGAL